MRTATPETVDMVVIRENTEGEYAAAGRGLQGRHP